MRRLHVSYARTFLQISAIALCSAASPMVSQTLDDTSSDTPIATLHEGSGGTLENGQILAEWQLRDGHLAGLSVRNKSASASAENAVIQMNNPFSISLQKVGVLQAAEMQLAGSPRVENIAPDTNAARYSDRLPGVAVHYELLDHADDFEADWELILRPHSSYIRQILTVKASAKPLAIDDVRLIDFHANAVEVAGAVKGSPLVAGDFFLGLESPLSQSSVVGDHGVSELQSGVPIGAQQSAQYSAVIGIAPKGQMRRAFLTYIERERAHPYRTFLHYNSWFDIGFFTPYTQQDALNRIHEIGDALHKQRGVLLDSYLFDDGWDDHNDLWKIRNDFKDGFAPLTHAAAEYGTAPGIWLSPWGGYGPPKQERVAVAKREGYEIVDGGLALSGPKYYERFHTAVLEMVTKYGVNQFKLDGTGNADQVVKGSAFSSDFDAAIHLISDLRKVKPDIYINLTSGTYPSPFWLFYADSIWRGGDDTEFAGVGSSRERWITYRDADTYDEVVKSGRLYPLNSIMLHGIVYAQKAPHLSTDPGGDFRNEVRSYFGSGTQLQELYITPSLLTKANWDDLAEAAKWSRSNAETLKDTHWIGGDPRWLSVYGWASWSAKKGILTMRNPSDKPQDFAVDIGTAFELPPTASQHYLAKSPWSEDVVQQAVDLHAGQPFTFHLAPFQVVTLEALPQ